LKKNKSLKGLFSLRNKKACMLGLPGKMCPSLEGFARIVCRGSDQTRLQLFKTITGDVFYNKKTAVKTKKRITRCPVDEPDLKLFQIRIQLRSGFAIQIRIQKGQKLVPEKEN
jgi:hypothetical protein